MIRKNQIYADKRNPGHQFLVLGKAKNDKWKLVQLTTKPGVYGTTHSFTKYIIQQKLVLVQ